MPVIQFAKEDFVEADGGFWFKAPFENASKYLVSIMRIEDDGTQTSIETDTRVLDDVIEVGVGREDLTFNGKILIM